MYTEGIQDEYFGASESFKREYTNRIKQIFRKVAPEKVQSVKKLVDKNEKDLQTLYLKICKKYGIKAKAAPRGEKKRSPTKERKATTPPKKKSTSGNLDENSQYDAIEDFITAAPSPFSHIFEILPDVYHRYERLLVAHGVDEDLLFRLHDQDFTELGISNSVHRKVLMKEIAKQRRRSSIILSEEKFYRIRPVASGKKFA